MNIACVVLAAGLGKRMKSPLLKVLHTINGRPMLQYVLNALDELKPRKIIVIVGSRLREIKESLEDIDAISFVRQKEADGTGDALLKAVPALKGFKGTVLVVNGDTPLVSKKTLARFLSLHIRRKNTVSMLSFESADPRSYGRVVRDRKGKVTSVVEDGDATAHQKLIREVNSGVYAIESGALGLLKEIKLSHTKNEYYLTDIIGIAGGKGLKTGAFSIGSEDEFIGVNTRQELEKARRFMKDRIIKRLTESGVRFIDARSVFISSGVEIGRNTVVYPNVHLEGNTKIGKGCTVYPNVRIQDSIIGDGAVIKDSTLIEGSVVANGASVGPFAHVRPGSVIGEGAKIGNFVEVKKSVVGAGSKASHLSYLGDAKIGKDVNIGAGTITCNYDGHQKHVTTVKDKVFIGSDTQLVAPVEIGECAFVGAGSTITRDVPANALAVSRVEQQNIEGWAFKRQLKVKSLKVKGKKGK